MKIRKLTALASGILAMAVTMSFPSMAAGWQHNETGYWYEREDQSYPAGTWEFIDGAWYLFGQDGYMLTGWQQTAGVWYYLGNDGAMAANVTLTIDGVPYTFDSTGALAGQEDVSPSMGHWEDRTFTNDWSGIRLTVPQDFVNLDSSALSAQSDNDASMDMLSMKNNDCAIMVLYARNKGGNNADELMSFLDMFHNGSLEIQGTGTMEKVKAGNLTYLRYYFPGTEANPRCGYLYIRNMGSYDSLIIAISNPENVPVMESILSTLNRV